MAKPTYYLWKNDFSTETAFETERNKYVNCGFRVITFVDGSAENNIHTGMKGLIKNHWNKF